MVSVIVIWAGVAMTVQQRLAPTRAVITESAVLVRVVYVMKDGLEWTALNSSAPRIAVDTVTVTTEPAVVNLDGKEQIVRPSLVPTCAHSTVSAIRTQGLVNVRESGWVMTAPFPSTTRTVAVPPSVLIHALTTVSSTSPCTEWQLGVSVT